MATLVLTAVGTLIGGPIGGAIGASLGQFVDQNVLFAPKPRQGPRLGDLAVQTSSYGSQIPKIFGTMRAAGTVIWATDLVEHKRTSGGKGQPKVVNYSYTASFAVALSGRRIAGIGRIWADGKLLRGAAGDLKSPARLRLHDGAEDQAADPLIAAAEGAGQAPAFRGTAYAVFEDMQLEDYGNRIPSLTFEIVAEPGPVAIGGIGEELAQGAVLAGTTPALTGYAALGDSVRGALEGLADVVPLSLADDGAVLRLEAGPGAAAALPAQALAERVEIVRRGAGAIPGEASIAYYDAGRDYQAGLQRAVRGPGRSVDRRSLPAVLGAGEAKKLADHRLSALGAGRTRARALLSWRGAEFRPGRHVALAGQPGLWRVERWTLGAMTTALELVRVPGAPPPELAASSGRPVSEADLPQGPTLLRLYDLPLGDGLETKPFVYAAAAGESAGWRRAALSASFDAGESWQELGGTAAPAVMGVAVDALPAAGSALFDLSSTVEVELLNAAMWLEGRSDDALVAGANLAVLGGELIQFGAVAPLGERRFRLSRLLRGRRGTEHAAAGHAAGEAFTLLARASLAAIEAPMGAEARLLASGAGDMPDAAEAVLVVEGEGLRPPSPVHLKAVETAGGDLAFSWVRRSRQGWAWTSGADTPLGEETELYLLAMTGPGFARTVESAAPAFLYTAAMRAADGPGPLAFEVVQIGSFGSSRPAFLTHD